MVQLEEVSSTALRAPGLTLPVQCHLTRHLFCAVSGREAAHSAGRTAADSLVNEYKTAFPCTCRPGAREGVLCVCVGGGGGGR